MDRIEILGDDIKLQENVKSNLECSKLCKGETDCSLWTYISGKCYLKDNRVFTVKKHMRVSGERNCTSTGKYLPLPYF